LGPLSFWSSSGAAEEGEKSVANGEKEKSQETDNDNYTAVDIGGEDKYSALPAATTAQSIRRASKVEEFTGGFKSEWMIAFEELAFEKKLGQGAFGIVYAGKWRGSTRVAIKQSTVLSVDEEAIEAFKKEALLMLSLRPHPNCVKTLGICIHETNVYVVRQTLL
jgi:hypothetical protein